MPRFRPNLRPIFPQPEDFRYRVGIADPAVKFHAYWDAEPAAKVIGGYWPEGNPDNNSKYWASAYSKPGKALVVVVRDSPANICGTTTVKVKLDRKKLGLPDGPLKCTNLESLGRSPLGEVKGDVLSVGIASIAESMDCTFAGIIIESAEETSKDE